MNLKEIRTSVGWSQTKLAEKMGVSRSTIAMWETKGSQPDNDNLLKLSEIFGVSIDYLLGKIDENDIIYQTAEGKYYLDKFSKLSLEEQKKLFYNELTPQEEYILLCFRNMNDQGKDYILETVNMAKLRYAVEDTSSYRIAAAPEVTPAKVDVKEKPKHS